MRKCLSLTALCEKEAGQVFEGGRKIKVGVVRVLAWSGRVGQGRRSPKYMASAFCLQMPMKPSGNPLFQSALSTMVYDNCCFSNLCLLE